MAMKHKGKYQLLADAMKVEATSFEHVADISTRHVVMLKFRLGGGYGNCWACFGSNDQGQSTLLAYGPRDGDQGTNIRI